MDAGRVIGFAYASRHRARAAYRWATDVGIYVDPAHRGNGAGRRPSRWPRSPCLCDG